MIDSDVIFGPWFFDALVDASGYAGRPLQRRRARRLATRGKIRCALFAASNPRVLGTRLLDGVAEVGDGRLRLWGQELWVQGVEPVSEQGPLQPRHADGNLLFLPATRIFTLRTHTGTVKWSVLEWQAEEALSRLGFGATAPGPGAGLR